MKKKKVIAGLARVDTYWQVFYRCGCQRTCATNGIVRITSCSAHNNAPATCIVFSAWVGDVQHMIRWVKMEKPLAS